MARIGKRYAKAFFESTDGNLAQARESAKALTVVKELFDNPEAAKILGSPVMPPELKKELLDYALDKAGASQEVRTFIHSLAGAQRTASIPHIVDSYVELIDDADGKVRAELVSAAALDDATRQTIGAALEQLLKKKVELVPEVDPSLMGGFKVRVGNFLVDLSLKTRLDSLSAGAVADRIG